MLFYYKKYVTWRSYSLKFFYKKKKVLWFTILIFTLMSFIPLASAASRFDAAYQQASEEAGNTTAKIVENLDLHELEEHLGLKLNEEEELLIRIALMSYSNGAMLQHPRGIDSTALASIDNTSAINNSSKKTYYIGNKNTKKFHYPDCDSVRDIGKTI